MTRLKSKSAVSCTPGPAGTDDRGDDAFHLLAQPPLECDLALVRTARRCRSRCAPSAEQPPGLIDDRDTLGLEARSPPRRRDGGSPAPAACSRVPRTLRTMEAVASLRVAGEQRPLRQHKMNPC